VAERWKLLVRDGASVRTTVHEDLKAALDELQSETVEAAGRPRAQELDLKVRTISPADRVVMRAEVKGPERLFAKTHAGVDVRGDQSVLPWTGGRKRVELKPRKGETPWQALRRHLNAS
jgi:hypothetical protein